MAVPIVKMTDQKRMEHLRTSESDVNACASAPTKVPADRRDVIMDWREESSL
jgi:hypothetical protein